MSFRVLPPQSVALLLVAASLVASCTEAAAPPKTSDEVPEQETEGSTGVSVSSEIGGLNEEKVNRSFESSLQGLERCLERGSSRVEFLGGSVSFFLKINTGGKVDAAYLERSTLGDRDTEKCMLEALRARSWPKPVGGQHGLARKSFDFDPPSDVRPPASYDPAHLSRALESISSQLGSCKGHRGTYEATVYVGTDGAVLAAGVTPPNESGEPSVDCLVQTLKAASFPSPGSWPAKVTFEL